MHKFVVAILFTKEKYHNKFEIVNLNNAAEDQLEVVEDQIESEEEKEGDEISMNVFVEIANSVEPSIKVEIDPIKV